MAGPGDRVSIKTSWITGDTDARMLSRFLAKVGSEMLYLKRGGIAFESRFDHLREFALYGKEVKFVPFVYGRGAWTETSVTTANMRSKSLGDCLIVLVSLRHVGYFLPLEREGFEAHLEKLAARPDFKFVRKAGRLDKEPFHFAAEFGPDEGGLINTSS